MKKILIIAPHDLVLDPRIKWMIESLSSKFEVTALGLKQQGKPDPSFSLNVKFFQINVNDKGHWIKKLQYIFVAMPVQVFVFTFVSFIFTLFLPLVIVFFLLFKSLIRKLNLKNRVREYFKQLSKRFVIGQAIAEIYFLQNLFSYFFQNLYLYAEFFKLKELPEADFIVANDLDSLLPAIYYKKKYARQAKLVYDAHEFYPFQFPNKSKLVSSALSFFERSLMRHLHSMITVTPHLADIITHYYKPNFIIHSIPNCAPLESGIKGTSFVMDKTIFLFQGIFAEGRGLERLIDYWVSMADDELLLILRGPESPLKKSCREKVEKFNNPNIIFDDPVPESMLVQGAMHAHVGIIPYEATSINNLNCCPNKLSQYMQAGLAIMANDLPFINLVLKQSEGGVLYKSDDFESFKNAILLLKDKRNLEMFQINNLNYVKAEYNWEKVSTPIIKEIFEKDEDTSRCMV